jgi:hypothetical protein
MLKFFRALVDRAFSGSLDRPIGASGMTEVVDPLLVG